MTTTFKGWLVSGLLLGTAIYAIAEEITLTTYYPSPRGVYQELKTAGDLVVGDITNPPAARLHVVGSGTAPALRVDDAPGATSPFLIDASGNVGIGSSSPTEKLVVAGDVKIGAGSGVTIRYVGGTNPSCPEGFAAKKWNDYTDPGFPVDCGASGFTSCPAGTYTSVGWAPVPTFTGGPTYICSGPTNPCSNLLGPSQNSGWSAILCLE